MPKIDFTTKESRSQIRSAYHRLLVTVLISVITLMSVYSSIGLDPVVSKSTIQAIALVASALMWREIVSLAFALPDLPDDDEQLPQKGEPVNLWDWANSRSFSIGGWIYVLRDLDITGYCKIGKTRQPYNRMKAFGVKLPIRTELVHVIKCDNADMTESVLHRRYDQYRKRGEWFDLPEKILNELKQVHEINSK